MTFATRLMSLSVVLMLTTLTSCQYLKPACTVINVASQACVLLAVKNPDGTVTKVPVSQVELEHFARETLKRRAANQ